MNDFDYDCYQKKQLAQSAKHRKGTVLGPKGCRLPHEYLTKKELEKMNGEIFSVNTYEKLSWEEFKALPTSLQTEYLQALLNRFGVGLNPIGMDLFGLKNTELVKWTNRHGIQLTLRTGGRISNAAKASWQRWLNRGTTSAPVSEVTEPEITEPETKEPEITEPEIKPLRAHDVTPTLPKASEVSENTNPYPLTDMNLTLKGTPVDVLTALRLSFPALLDADLEYRFNISVNVCARERRPEHL